MTNVIDISERLPQIRDEGQDLAQTVFMNQPWHYRVGDVLPLGVADALRCCPKAGQRVAGEGEIPLQLRGVTGQQIYSRHRS